MCAGRDKLGRIQAADDEAVRKRLGENRPPSMPDPADGRRNTVRMKSPAEVEAAKAGDQPNQIKP